MMLTKSFRAIFKICFLMFILAFLSGCTLAAYTHGALARKGSPAPDHLVEKVRKVRPKFEALCESNAGNNIYEVVSGVDGIIDDLGQGYCIICDEALLKDGYKFIEYNVKKKPHKLDERRVSYLDDVYYQRHYVFGPGLYRFTLEEANHPNCKGFYRKFESVNERRARMGLSYIDSRPRKKFEGKCIAAWKISDHGTDFKLSRNDSIGDDEGMPGNLAIFHTVLSGVKSKKLYAEHFWYRFTTDSRKCILCSGGKFKSLSCPKIDAEDFFSSQLTTKVFRPKGSPRRRE